MQFVSKEEFGKVFYFSQTYIFFSHLLNPLLFLFLKIIFEYVKKTRILEFCF